MKNNKRNERNEKSANIDIRNEKIYNNYKEMKGLIL